MKKTVLALFIIIAITGCTTSQPDSAAEKGTTLSKFGIRFDCPNGWEITADKQMLENEYFAVCEKQGAGESGIVLFKWTAEPVTAAKMLELIKDYYQSVYADSHGIAVEFEKTDEKNNRVLYRFTAEGIKHQGWMQARLCPLASAGIIFQSTKDDKDKYESAFEKIEKSFACN